MERTPDEYETIRDDEPDDDDTSGGPLSGGAGEGSGHGAEGAPDIDVSGGAESSSDATDDAVGG